MIKISSNEIIPRQYERRMLQTTVIPSVGSTDLDLRNGMCIYNYKGVSREEGHFFLT